MAEAAYKRIAVDSVGQELEVPSWPKLNRHLVFVALAATLVFIACSLFYVWAHQQMISLGYEISQAQEEEQTLLKTNKRLRLELASLKSPGRIEGKALKEFGFVKPEKEQLIIVR
jgi:cell division protein FtsL